jgi:hypothetical protein
MRGSKFPGNMHNYIWCPYYLPRFMKFCSVVSEELRWQAASVVNFAKFLSSKRHNSHNIQAINISWYYAQLHMVSLLPTKFHEILFSSFRGVAQTNCVTDRTKTICLPTKVGGRHNLLSRHHHQWMDGLLSVLWIHVKHSHLCQGQVAGKIYPVLLMQQVERKKSFNLVLSVRTCTDVH